MLARFKQYSILAALLLLGSVAAKASQEELDLQVKQAKLNAKMNVLDQINEVYGRYIVVRDAQLNGVKGFHPQIRAWFERSGQWLSDWNQVLILLQDNSLADSVGRSKAASEIQAQIEALSELMNEQDSIIQAGLAATSHLAAIPVVSSSDLPLYRSQIDALNTQVRSLLEDTNTSLLVFSSKLVRELEIIAEKINEAMVLKAKYLALNFPELEGLLDEVKLTIDTIAHVDSILAKLSAVDAEIARLFAENRPYKGIAVFEELKNLAAESLEQLMDTPLPDAVKNVGRVRIEALISKREEAIERILAVSTKASLFSRYYTREVMDSRNGLLVQCMQVPMPIDIDCQLLKTIAGFKSSDFRRMDDELVAYISQSLDRVKMGPLGSAVPAKGNKK